MRKIRLQYYSTGLKEKKLERAVGSRVDGRGQDGRGMERCKKDWRDFRQMVENNLALLEDQTGRKKRGTRNLRKAVGENMK